MCPRSSGRSPTPVLTGPCVHNCAWNAGRKQVEWLTIINEAFGAAGKTTPVGFEPTRGDPIGLAGRRLNRSAKVSFKKRRSIINIENLGWNAARLRMLKNTNAQLCHGVPARRVDPNNRILCLGLDGRLAGWQVGKLEGWQVGRLVGGGTTMIRT